MEHISHGKPHTYWAIDVQLEKSLCFGSPDLTCIARVKKEIISGQHGSSGKIRVAIKK